MVSNGFSGHSYIKHIARILRESGLTQAELSARAGLQPNHVSRILAGQTDIRISTFMCLCYALSKTPSDMLGIDEPDVETLKSQLRATKTVLADLRESLTVYDAHMDDLSASSKGLFYSDGPRS